MPSEADMQQYYKMLLPFRYLFQWLLHLPAVTEDFTKRDIAWELRNEIYQRYNSFTSEKEFHDAVCRANPMRFEIGAVYTHFPNQRKVLPKLALKPVAKELVFDIDLTDYDDIRTCCQDKAICTKCWRFIQVATTVIDDALRNDFGFEHLVWVFSGRRGAHCWVSDRRARELDEAGRKAIIDYLDVTAGKSIRKPYHPLVERAFDHCKTQFEEVILREQDPWNTSSTDETTAKKRQANVDDLLDTLPDKKLREALRTKWTSPLSLADKWRDLNDVAAEVCKGYQLTAVLEAKKDIILRALYPRLDVNVSKQLNHLLKSPFCVHPATGNICVPFDPKQNLSGDAADDAYGFNPTTLPKLIDIQRELEAWRGDSDNEHWMKTSLKPYVEYFGRYVTELYKSEILKKRRAEDEPSPVGDLTGELY